MGFSLSSVSLQATSLAPSLWSPLPRTSPYGTCDKTSGFSGTSCCFPFQRITYIVRAFSSNVLFTKYLPFCFSEKWNFVLNTLFILFSHPSWWVSWLVLFCKWIYVRRNFMYLTSEYLCLEASVFCEQVGENEASLPGNSLILAVFRFTNYMAIGSHLNRILEFYLWGNYWCRNKNW